jgi:CRISPR-associated protein Csb2
VLAASARSVVALGWGIDLVAAHARILSPQEQVALTGERWLPAGGHAPTRLRAPRQGTLGELRDRHARFLRRLAGGSFVPVPPVGAYREVAYRRASDPAPRPFAAFQTLTADAGRPRVFDPRTDRHAVRNVAAMTRHAVAEAARDAGWREDEITTYVLGHDLASGAQARGGPDLPRFAFLPLPTIDPRGVVGSICRVLLAEPPGGSGERAAWLRRMLSGRDLVEEHSRRPQAMLSVVPDTDGVLGRYLGPEEGASEWSSVTPVILTGYDGGDARKAEKLLRKAIREAGYALLSESAGVTWRNVGFRPGLEPSLRYVPPRSLEQRPRFHVLISWRDGAGRPVPIRGPVVIGAGRYQGFGTFAVHGTAAARAGGRSQAPSGDPFDPRSGW